MDSISPPAEQAASVAVSPSDSASAPAVTLEDASADPFRAQVARLLQAGVLAASIFCGLGLVLYLLVEEPLPLWAGARAAAEPPAVPGNGWADPLGLIALGIFVLAALPIARVGLSVLYFARARDRAYLAITASVLVLLGVGMALGGGL